MKYFEFLTIAEQAKALYEMNSRIIELTSQTKLLYDKVNHAKEYYSPLVREKYTVFFSDNKSAFANKYKNLVYSCDIEIIQVDFYHRQVIGNIIKVHCGDVMVGKQIRVNFEMLYEKL